jgi:hypothetical protein
MSQKGTGMSQKGTGTFIAMLGGSRLLPGEGDCVNCKRRRSAELEKGQKVGLLPEYGAPEVAPVDDEVAESSNRASRGAWRGRERTRPLTESQY